MGAGGKAQKKGLGVFIHCLGCLLESGFWKTKSPATHHLCLCERPRLCISHRQSLGSCLCYVYLYQAPKGLYLRTQHTSFSQVLACFVPLDVEADVFSKEEFLGRLPHIYSSSCPFLTQPRHPVSGL